MRILSNRTVTCDSCDCYIKEYYNANEIINKSDPRDSDNPDNTWLLPCMPAEF